MKKIIKILKSTTVKIISLVLIVSFAISVFLFYDFYKRQYHKLKGFYWIYRGDKAFKNQDLQSAVNCYEHGIKLYPKHYRAMYNLANIYVVYEDYYSALKNYEKALSVKPSFEIARIDYAIILSQTYETDKAIDEYKKVIENQPKFYKIPFILDKEKSYKYNRGIAYYNMGRAYRTKSLIAGLKEQKRVEYLVSASKSYEKAREILNSYNANYNLALMHQLLKQKNQAGYYYCKAMEISPMEYEAHFNLGVLLNDMGLYKEAGEEFKKAGLLLSAKDDNIKTKYVYNILYEVNQKIAISSDEEYVKKIKQQQALEDSKMEYNGGKLVVYNDSEEYLKNLHSEFSTCEKKEIFMGDE